MPRVTARRSLANERNIAERVRFEREKRGWSYDGLARRMADAGYPIASTAIFKVEKGDPPRRITVDELVGLAQVFGLDIGEMVAPMNLVLTAEARAAMNRLIALDDELGALVERLRAAGAEWHAVSAASRTAHIDATLKTVAGNVAAAFPNATWADVKAARQELDASISPQRQRVNRAVDELVDAVLDLARHEEGGDDGER